MADARGRRTTKRVSGTLLIKSAHFTPALLDTTALQAQSAVPLPGRMTQPDVGVNRRRAMLKVSTSTPSRTA
jgi:hypothetical protein